ncbi:ParA family protein [Tengunoibacter tsumagoiensis]|uniref:Chromosome partitioning protein ParA n=1 Tax=Tengunoibacter tsumagoiensis TaxID=2014871 RepID=A0A402A1U9_9CHLR|nr:ParA family protein [Tengunoibacter tsumagoiensis]GCE13128.1 chromosome partitioning protein ParA [Tengunoibacter tsumagoiensis]
MAQIVTIINFKGGVGKTVTSIELATSLARHFGRKTLLIDLDPQASASFYVMEQDHWKMWKNLRGTSANLFEKRDRSFPIHNAIVPDVLQGKAPVIGFDILPSDPNLIDVDLSLADFFGYTILQHYLDELQNDYDYIICDCPPNFNPVTKNSLWASDAYLIPTVPDFLSTYGIGLLQRAVKKLFPAANQQQRFNGPTLVGIVLTRIKQTNLSSTYSDKVIKDYPNQVFTRTISDSVKVAEAADNRLPISAISKPREKEAELQEQFKELAGEFIQRMQNLHLYQ